MKKCLSLCLALALCLGLSAPAVAAGPTFPDVPESHWAYEFVEKAAAEGWVTGVGNGLFGVDNQVSYAEFSTMLVRAYYEEDLNAYTGPTDQWYTSFCNVANDHNLYWNTNAYRDDYLSYVVNPLNRYDMAQMLFTVLESYSILTSNDQALKDSIADWDSIPEYYQPAVVGVVSVGLISGVDDSGTFNGDGVMTRGQAAVVMCRLDEVINGGGVTQPEDPEPTPDPEPTAGLLKNGKEATPENVIEMLKEIEEEYPTGTVWMDPTENPDTPHNPNPVSQTVGRTMEGLYGTNATFACGGFAAMVSDLIFPEDMAMREVTDLSQVRPGDIVFNVGRDGRTVGHVWIALSESWYDEQSGTWQVDGRGEGNVGDEVMWSWGIASMVRDLENAPAGRGYQVVYTRYPD